MTPTEAPVNLRAGARLRRLREAKQMTQRDLARETAARFGPEGIVVSQQISRIEKGQIDKPPMLDLVHIGEILGLTPGEILEFYGLWTPPTRDQMDPVLLEAISLQQHLPSDLREKHRGWIEFANLQAAAEARSSLRKVEEDLGWRDKEV